MRQGIIIIEHKIRNLEKRKGKLDSYRALQNEGKTLQAEQLSAVAKYDEVMQTLEFARDLSKSFTAIQVETARQTKKQARTEAFVKTVSDRARIKEVLIVQNVLNQIGTDAVREDFLNGSNGATQLSETDLQLFDTFYETVTPKAFEDAQIPVEQQLSTAADHYLSTIEGKSKEFGGVTYAVLKEKIMSVHNCGYFDKPATQPEPETPAETNEAPEEEQSVEVVEEQDDAPAPEVVPPTFQAPPEAVHPVLPQMPVPAQPPVQVPLRPHDVINSVTSGSFNFLQESELDSPDPSGPPPAHQIPPAIPTPAYTNQNFAPPQVNPPPASAVPMYHPPQHPPPPHMQPVHQLPGEGFNNVAPNTPANLPIPQPHLPVSPNVGNPSVMPYQQQMYSPHADRFEQPRSDHVNENHLEPPQGEPVNQPSQNINNKWQSETEDWNNSDDWNAQPQSNEWSNSNNNDGGYQTQRNNRDRGDREQRGGGRGKRGGPFNGYGGRGRGDYQNRPYYRNNAADGGNNYYQNGYNKDGQGGGYRGGRGQGGVDRPRPNRGGMDRGGPRGGGPRGNSRGRGGGFRGGQTGGQGVPTGGPGPKQ